MIGGKSGGSIVLTSAAVSQLGTANHDVLAAAKGAVQSLALGAASTYSEHNIRINCIAPGLIECVSLSLPVGWSVSAVQGTFAGSLQV